MVHRGRMFSEAAAYERFMGRWSRRLAPALVELAAVREGDAVLEIGCGTGELARAVLGATRTTTVTGIDRSAEYVAHARSATPDERARFGVGDAQKLDFDDATFDRTMSLLVLNFVPDRARALSEMLRV